jgi:glycosyltransferase involved in cell wall biosynthesis
MSAGIPVIASDFPLWKSIVSTADCGICVNPLDTKELATAIQKLLEDDELCRRLGENGREAVQQQYNWEMESRKLIELYSEILKGE